MHSYASSAGTVGVALGLALVKEATSTETLAQAPIVPLPLAVGALLALVSVPEDALVTDDGYQG